MKSLSIYREINASLESVWGVLSDVGNYSKYAPNIDASSVISGEKVGLIRECSNKDGSWQEICTDWQEFKCYRFTVQTKAEKYPYPFKTLLGLWEVKPINKTTSLIRMEFNVEFKSRVIGWLLYPLMKRQFLLVCENLIDNWQIEMLNIELKKNIENNV